MNNLKKALQNMDFTEEQLSQIRKAVMEEADEAHLRIEEDKTDPMIGKWLKCVDDWLGESLVLDCWYKVMAISNTGKIQVNLPRAVYFERKRFDLTDPRDYEPKTVPADILEGLNLLPEDHPEFGNLRKKAIECAERLGPYEILICSKHKIAASLQKAFQWAKTEMKDRGWTQVFKLAESGAFDPKPVEKRIEFDYERWKKGEYIRVETRDGIEVKKLTDFGTKAWPLSGVISGAQKPSAWTIEGNFEYVVSQTINDLFLVVNE